jgi:small subunit ribosomal protein S9
MLTLNTSVVTEVPVQAQETRKPKKDKLGRSYGTGRRKNAVARVWVKAGVGKVTVNGLDAERYFPSATSIYVLLQPFMATKTSGKFDVVCTVKGGGHAGQAGAILLGVARALDNFDPAFHATLRQHGLLTRDPRVVERKKYGKHKARKSTQFSKR